MRRALLLAAAMLASTLIAPLAVADHVYSHRYVFEGRVLDVEGRPVPGAHVELYSVGWDARSPCQRSPHQDVTDENGDFRFCHHLHEASATWRVGVTVNGTRCDGCEKPMDTAFRRTVVTITLPNATGVAPPLWDRTFEFTGKVWRSGATLLEDVPVYGLAIANATVNVSLVMPNRTATREAVATDGFGDFDATFQLEEGVDPAEVEVVLESFGMTHRRKLDTFAHRQTVGFLLPAEAGGPRGVDINFPQSGSASTTPPGATTPGIPAALFVGFAVLAVGTIVLRKWRERQRGP